MKTDISQKPFYVSHISNVVNAGNDNLHKSIRAGEKRYDTIAYILEGSATYKFDSGTEFTVKKGDIMFIPIDAKYSVYIHEHYRLIYCDFHFSSNEERESRVYSPKNSEHTENLFKKLFNCFSSSSKNAFTETLSTFYEIYGLVMLTANREYTANSARNKIRDIKNSIDVNFKNPELSITKLAKDAEMSEVYLRKLFKAEYDISPSQYIISVRLKNAKNLMAHPIMTLEECALQSGFSTLQYFCRVFKNSTGQTPNAYRNKNK